MNTERSTRNEIIEKGAGIIHLKGYNGTGLQEILESAGVPKGSFYFYFKSKEDFGLEVIDYFSRIIEGIFSHYLGEDGVPPLQRFANLAGFYGKLFKKQNYTLGCPIGNLSLEMADTNERFRERLGASIDRMVGMIEACITLAQKDGSVRSGIDASGAARFIFYGFEGAILHVKVTKDLAPLETFRDFILQYMAQPGTAKVMKTRH